MSRLDKLIEKLCPDGVEMHELQELFITRNGYTPSKSKSEFWKNGTVPWFKMEDIRANGNILSDALQYVNECAVKGQLFPENSIIVATSATVGEHALITVPSLANQRFTYLMVKPEYEDMFMPKFLFYYCYKLDAYCLQNLNQSSFASVDMKKFAKFKFPVPPLEVQREIVHILDRFTLLTAELTAELTARKKQYEFYRDKLLTFGNDTLECRLKDICDIFLGLTATPNYTDAGVKFISAQNTSNDFLDLSNVKYISETDFENATSNAKPQRGDLLFTRVGSNLGHPVIVKTDEKLCIFVSLGYLRVRNKKQVVIGYLKHWMNTDLFWSQVRKNVHGAAKVNLNTGWLKEFRISLPPLETQERIVHVLDNFEAICTDLNIGLPAEIEARQKQYEYYRDLLLTYAATGTIITQTDRQN